eukprot:1137522-Pelagomonas_calceolata.AAC.1
MCRCIAENQAIQGDDTPADTAFHCVNPRGNPFRGTWLAFKGAARVMTSLQAQPSTVSIQGAIPSVTPHGLPSRELPAPMQINQNAPTHQPQSLDRSSRPPSSSTVTSVTICQGSQL